MEEEFNIKLNIPLKERKKAIDDYNRELENTIDILRSWGLPTRLDAALAEVRMVVTAAIATRLVLSIISFIPTTAVAEPTRIIKLFTERQRIIALTQGRWELAARAYEEALQETIRAGTGAMGEDFIEFTPEWAEWLDRLSQVND